MRTAIIVMGVSGSGKTAVATLLSGRLGWRFTDGEDLLPPESIAKLRAGRSLAEVDHRAWLGRIRDRINRSHANQVVTCSALRRTHRDVLREANASVIFVHLEATRGVQRGRTMLQSDRVVSRAQLEAQLAVLEPLEVDEVGVRISASHDPSWVVEEILDALGFEL